MAKSVTAMLKAAQEDWEGSEARQGGGVPDGIYDGVIESAVVAVAKGDTPRAQCAWTLKVTEGELKGRKQMKFSNMTSADNLAWFKGDLEAIEIDPPDDLSKIGGVLVDEAEGLAIKFKVRTSKKDEATFTNVDFLGRLEGGSTSEDSDDDDSGLIAADVQELGSNDDEDGLQAVIDENGLDINQDAVATYPEVADMIVDQLKLE